MKKPEFTRDNVKVNMWVSLRSGAKGQIVQIRKQGEVARGLGTIVVQIDKAGTKVESYFTQIVELENPYTYAPPVNRVVSGGNGGL